MNHPSSADPSHDILWNAVLSLAQSVATSSPKPTLALHYGQWTMAVKLFRFVEEWVMYRQEPTPRDVIFHKIAITALISSGESLRRQLTEVTPSHRAEWGLSIETAEIHVRALEDSYAEWHLPIAKERKSELHKTIFDSDGNPPSSS